MTLALVTGGAGFIGSHLCEQLAADGIAVRVLDDLSMGRRENLPAGAELAVGDVRDPATVAASLEGVDLVFHLAAKVSIRGSMDRFLDDGKTNVGGTLALLEACRLASRRPRRLVLASSMAVYGDAPHVPISEDAPAEPASPYGIAKLASERYVRAIAPHLGIESVVLRYFNTYGERQTPTPYVGVITIFLRALLAGETATIFGDGSQRRDYVDARDVASATLLAGTVPAAAGGTFNVGTGRGTSVRELHELLCEATGRRGAPAFAPLPPGEPRDSIADTRRAAELLGFRARSELRTRLPEVALSLAR